MNNTEIQATALDVLSGIAPEIEKDTIRSDRALRDQIDLDSMDWLNFLIGLHERLKVDIPESDYARLTSLDAITRYLSQKLTSAGR